MQTHEFPAEAEVPREPVAHPREGSRVLPLRGACRALALRRGAAQQPRVQRGDAARHPESGEE